MFRVVSLKQRPWPATFVYVGRPFAGLAGSPLGNPFKGPGAVAKYRAWLDAHPNRERLLWDALCDTEAGRLPLACWCGNWRTGEPRIECHAVAVAEALMHRFGAVTLPAETGETP